VEKEMREFIETRGCVRAVLEREMHGQVGRERWVVSRRRDKREGAREDGRDGNGKGRDRNRKAAGTKEERQ
jgi:hypothetical protein